MLYEVITRKVSGKKARIREKKDWLTRKDLVVPSEGEPEALSEEQVLPGEEAEREPESASPKTTGGEE